MIEVSTDIKNFIAEHRNDDIKELALRLNKYDVETREFILNQISGYQSLKKKHSTLASNSNLLYPKHLSVEQSSSEETANYKQEIIDAGEDMIDLTGGFGIDFIHLSEKFQRSAYIERNEELCLIAKHNFSFLLHNNYKIINGDSVNFLSNERTEHKYSLIYADPARRDEAGNKVFLIEDCTPNIVEQQDLLYNKAEQFLIKFSPMLDITNALSKLKFIDEIHIVSVNSECKELLLKSNKTHNPDTKYFCTDIAKGKKNCFSFTDSEKNKSDATYANALKKYLYEPNSSVMKSGAFSLISERFGIEKLALNTQLYTSDTLISDFPGRSFVINKTFKPSQKELKTEFSDIGKANITVRNYPLDVASIRKKYKIKDGGSTYVFATCINENNTFIFCEKI